MKLVSRNIFGMLVAASLLSLPGLARLEAKTYKIGTMIPEGTSYAKLLGDMGDEIKSKTDGRVKFKFFYGGLAGDEPDVMRKIHVGQLHGGVFTAKALSDLYKDVRVLEVPFSFKSRKHAGAVLDALRPTFAKGFEEVSFESLGIYETGEIYIVTKEKAVNVDGLKGKKLWLLEGDKMAETFTKSLDLVAVPVALPDVLTSLSTGLIEAAYAPSLGIIALQWHSKVSYIIEPPFAFHFQGFLLGPKAWKKISDSDKKIVKDIAKRYEGMISETNLKEADKAFEAIKKQGVEVVTWPKSDLDRFATMRASVMKALVKEEVLSQNILDAFNKELKAKDAS